MTDTDREAQARAIKAKANRIKVTADNVVDFIMEYEGGEIDAPRTLALFRYLVKTGQAWSLQGSYGRAAMALIEAGWIAKPKRARACA